LTGRIDALLAEAQHLDVALEDIVKLVQQRHAAMQSSRNEE
jgi:hypothetical protein